MLGLSARASLNVETGGEPSLAAGRPSLSAVKDLRGSGGGFPPNRPQIKLGSCNPRAPISTQPYAIVSKSPEPAALTRKPVAAGASGDGFPCLSAGIPASGHRTIKLPPGAIVAIKAALLWKKQRRLKMGPKFRDEGTLFCTPSARPIDRRVLRARDHLPRIRRLGLPEARIYDFRHLNITYTIADGVDIRTVADRAGHKDPGYLIRRYAHAVGAAQERAAEVGSKLVAKSVGLA